MALVVAATLAGAALSNAQPSTVSTVAGYPAVRPAFVYPQSVAWDPTGLYVTNPNARTIVKIDPATGDVSVFAGRFDEAGFADGIGSAARFILPYGIASDGAGNLYVTDYYEHSVRKIRIATREVTTIAGNIGWSGSGSVDGSGLVARFNRPTDLAVEGDGLYVTDTGNYTIRRVDLRTGFVTTVAGLAGVRGNADGTGSAARFDYLDAVTADGSGHLYVADYSGIRKIDLSTSVVTTVSRIYEHGLRWGDGALHVCGGGTVSRIDLTTGRGATIAGSPYDFGYRDGVGSVARFDQARGLSFGPAGTLYVVDSYNGAVRRIDLSTRAVTTVARHSVRVGSEDGYASAARFKSPSGIASDGRGSLYVADRGNKTIRKIDTRTKRVTTVAGTPGEGGTSNGPFTRFSDPVAVALDGADNLYVLDAQAGMVRKIALATGAVTTVAGPLLEPGQPGSTGALLFPTGLASDGADGLYVVDSNNVIRKITLSTGHVTTIAGTAGTCGTADGVGPSARFCSMWGIVHAAGSLYVSDHRFGDSSASLRRIDLSTGLVTTVAGPAPGGAYNADGPGTAAGFRTAGALAWDGSGVLIGDVGSIRRYDVASGNLVTIAGRTDYYSPREPKDGEASSARMSYPMGLAWDAASRSLYFSDYGSQSIRKLAPRPTAGGCTPGRDPETLCLRDGAFEAAVTWKNQYASGATGVGAARLLTSDTGAFTFFSPENVELVVKVLDGSAVNGRTWVLYGALSDVEYTLTVTDVRSGASKSYLNPPGHLASLSDIDAFASLRAPTLAGRGGDEYGRLASLQKTEPAPLSVSSSAAPSAPSGPCATVGTDLCLSASRFLVRAAFRNYNDGAEGQGQATALTSDTGTFWFFDPANIELVVKVLDGRAVNGKFWVAYGALTDVEYTITVTDSAIGTSRTYHNPPHTLASRIDVGAFP